RRERPRAMARERSRLWRPRAHVARRVSGGAKGTGAGCALEPALRAPNSCMAFTLAKAAARSNSHRPPPGGSPPADAVAKGVRRVAVPHPGGDTRGAPLALHPHPHHRRVREGTERLAVERRAP